MRSRTSVAAGPLFVLIGLSLHCGEDKESVDSQCDDMTAEAYQKTAIADADLACDTDADCALVRTDVSCLSGCGYRVAVNQASSIPERVQSVESELCTDYAQLGCPIPIPLPCPPPATNESAVCNAGRCEVQSPE